MANGNGKNRKRKRVFYVGGSILAVIVIALVVMAATRGGTKIDPAKLGKVERGDLTKSVVATGKIEPITKVELKSKASGIVEKWFADAGDKVKEGQVLVQLDRERWSLPRAASRRGQRDRRRRVRGPRLRSADGARPARAGAPGAAGRRRGRLA